ncbi:MAG: hypothetical protein HC936_19620 [Leptolyngbyaceae cyanobacterium SU_3_3]|nr:hypothetical protein [Leptolyngbyaceae cyanobacterium SU_3_3]
MSGLTAKFSGGRSTRIGVEKTQSVRCNAVLGSTFALNEKYFAPLLEADYAIARSTSHLTSQPTKRATIELTNRTREARHFALTTRSCPTVRLSGCK